MDETAKISSDTSSPPMAQLSTSPSLMDESILNMNLEDMSPKKSSTPVSNEVKINDIPWLTAPKKRPPLTKSKKTSAPSRTSKAPSTPPNVEKKPKEREYVQHACPKCYKKGTNTMNLKFILCDHCLAQFNNKPTTPSSASTDFSSRTPK